MHHARTASTPRNVPPTRPRARWLVAALVLAGCGAPSSDDGAFVEDQDPMQLTWVSPGATLAVGEPIDLAVATDDPSALVVHFAVDGVEVDACDASDPDQDCHTDALWQGTAVVATAGRHTLRATFQASDGSTRAATQDIDVAPTAPATDAIEAATDETDPLDPTQLVAEGTGSIAQALTEARGYLDASLPEHSVCGGQAWSVEGQRVVLAGGARIDGSTSAVARCMASYGASVQRYADLRYLSRASVVAQLVRVGNCNSARWQYPVLPAANCAAATGLSRAACRVAMRSNPDFAIDALTRYLSTPTVLWFHHRDPVLTAIALEGRTAVSCSRRDAWHLVESSRNSTNTYVAAYNAYRTWEDGTAVAPPPHVVTLCPGVTLPFGGASGALQRCIDATPAGGTLALPAGTYAIDAQLSFTRPITLRTAGVADGAGSCLGGASCVVLQAMPAFDAANGMVALTDTTGVRFDHIVLDGNRGARLHSHAAAQCAGGNNRVGFNAYAGNCAGCGFTRSVSMNALCGTGFEWTGEHATITRSEFRNNGDHNTHLMWSDGLTLLSSDHAVVSENVFANNSDVDFISGGARGATFSDNQISQSSQASFAGLMLDNFNGGTPGDFTGTDVTGNTIACGGKCDFGIELGPHAWYRSANITGGTVAGNTVTNAKEGINVDGAGTAAAPIHVASNSVQGSPSSAHFNCGNRATSSLNISADSVVDRGGEASPATNVSWNGCP